MFFNNFKYIYLLFVAISCFPVNALHLGEDFYNDTAPGWSLYRSAFLTSPSIDSNGNGWLRLTNDARYISGNAVSKDFFSSEEGLEIELEYTMFSSSNRLHADGFSVYLVDSIESNPIPGATGSSLGYTLNTSAGAGAGVPNGYLGIGFDLYGAYSLGASGACGIPCGKKPNSVAVRGRDTSGVGRSGYSLLIAKNIPSGKSLQTTSNNDPKSVKITLTKPPQSKLSVEMNFNDGLGFVKIIEDFDIVANNGIIPPFFRLGFGAATGEYTNQHQIRLKRVAGAQETTTNLDFSSLKSCGPVSLTARVTKNDINNPDPTGEVIFESDGVEIGRASLINGVAVLNAKLSAGVNHVDAIYGGDSVFASSTSSQLIDRTAAECPFVDILKFASLNKDDLVPQNGSIIPYVVYVDNLSDSSVSNVSFLDSAPQSMRFGQWQCMVVILEGVNPNSICPENLPVGDIEINNLTLMSKERFVFSVDATVLNNSVEMDNIARITFPSETSCQSQTQSVPGSQDRNYCESSVSFPPSTKLDIDKSTSISSNKPPLIGSIVPYVIRVTNEGSWDSNQVTLVDEAPDGLVFGQWSCRVLDAGSHPQNSNCPLNLPSGNLIVNFDIAAGAVIAFTVDAEVVNNKVNLTNEAYLTLPSDTACVNDASGSPREPCSSNVFLPKEDIKPVPFSGLIIILAMNGLLLAAGLLIRR